MTDEQRDPEVPLADSGTAADALTIAVQEGRWAYATTGGGWMHAEHENGDVVLVRFERERDDEILARLQPVELRIEAKGPIDSTMLRRIPLTAMESMANSVLRTSLWEPESEPNPAPAIPRGWAKRLKNIPPGPKPDKFYETIAMFYERLAVKSNRPAAELAEAAEVPPTTAHRWVKRARQLGYLPPGQKGRRG